MTNSKILTNNETYHICDMADNYYRKGIWSFGLDSLLISFSFAKKMNMHDYYMLVNKIEWAEQRTVGLILDEYNNNDDIGNAKIFFELYYPELIERGLSSLIDAEVDKIRNICGSQK